MIARIIYFSCLQGTPNKFPLQPKLPSMCQQTDKSLVSWRLTKSLETEARTTQASTLLLQSRRWKSYWETLNSKSQIQTGCCWSMHASKNSETRLKCWTAAIAIGKKSGAWSTLTMLNSLKRFKTKPEDQMPSKSFWTFCNRTRNTPILLKKPNTIFDRTWSGKWTINGLRVSLTQWDLGRIKEKRRWKRRIKIFTFT